MIPIHLLDPFSQLSSCAAYLPICTQWQKSQAADPSFAQTKEADSVNCRLRAEKFVPNLGLKQADKEEWHVVQALRENQRLKEEVAQEHQRRQVAIDLLLGANPQ